MRRLKILTWHVHGNYLYYLTQSDHEFYLPVAPGRPAGYGGRGATFPFGAHVREVPSEHVQRMHFDCVLLQSVQNYVRDQHEVLSPEQRSLPRIYLEHDPPRESVCDTRHVVDDPNVLLVHVTPFNDLMWNPGRTPTRVIEHGVLVPEGIRYSGEIERGIVVVNNLANRGRRLGSDVFEAVRRDVPLDLVGMGSEALGGLGEIPPMRLAAFEARYRLFFNPIRYTSLGLAVCEAMMLGMPIVGLATTELATVVENGRSGLVDTRVSSLVDTTKRLLRDKAEAARLGEGARRTALDRFNINRFVAEWDSAFRDVAGAGGPVYAGAALEAAS